MSNSNGKHKVYVKMNRCKNNNKKNSPKTIFKNIFPLKTLIFIINRPKKICFPKHLIENARKIETKRKRKEKKNKIRVLNAI